MRLFLAAELAPEMRRRLAEVQEELRGSLAGWRWVRAGAIHLTLRFLGEVDAEREAACRPAWREAVSGVTPFKLALGAVGRFPPSGQPRVLWVGVDADPADRLELLARLLERAAVEQGFAPERRPYRPHLTLARAAARAQPPPSDLAVSGPHARVGEVVLFRSHLGSGGARYTALDRIALGG